MNRSDASALLPHNRRTRPCRRRLGSAMVVLTALLFQAPVLAQDEPPEMVTDRPDQTESAALVPPGYTQVEIGLGIGEDEDGEVSSESLSGFETLLRIGLIDRVELRIGLPAYVSEETTEGNDRSDASGLTDASFGFKLHLREEAGGAPAMALIAAASLPVGNDGFSSERVDPALILAASHTLSSRLDLGYNLGFQRASVASRLGRRETNTDFSYSVALAIGAGPRAGWFVELLGNRNLDGEADSNVLGKGGLVYLLRPNVQLDASVTIGLTDSAEDAALGVGVSFRLPR